ncbi:MAG: radical SAM protein [Magnetococcales bacterium]|nr:radical SAM protein [Magnetococcales bacterium]
MSEKLRILLLTPNIKGIKGGINRIQPSLGVGYIAAVLKQAGHEVFIRDTALEGYNQHKTLNDKMVLVGESDEAVAAYISHINPHVVGISVLFSNLLDHACTIAKITKTTNPKITVVIGGNHVSSAMLDHEFALKNPQAGIPPSSLLSLLNLGVIDYALQGEGEFTFLDIVNLLAQKQQNEIETLPGVVHMNEGQLHINPRPPAVELNRLPFPARELMNMEGYFKIGLFHSGLAKSNRVLSVMASRGCPEFCSFCTTPLMWGSKVRWREPQNIYEEIKEGVDKYGIVEVQFEDDTLTANRKNLLELCRLIKPLGIRWCTPNGIKVNYHKSNNKQLEMYQQMADSGCYQITLACESGVQRVLDDVINKNLLLEEIKPSIESAKKAGLLVHTFWMVGFPGETREEMEETVRFAASVGADSYTVSIMCPLPGTPVYHKIAKDKLWWNDELEHSNILYRNSLMRIDGFDSPHEFETWVDEKTLYLNELLKKRDPAKFAAKYKKGDSGKFLLKQT